MNCTPFVSTGCILQTLAQADREP